MVEHPIQRQIAKLQPIHNAMRQIEKLWKQVKSESARPNPDKEKIERLKQEMTRRAKIFIRIYLAFGTIFKAIFSPNN